MIMNIVLLLLITLTILSVGGIFDSIQKLYKSTNAQAFSETLSKMSAKVINFIDSIPYSEQFPLFHSTWLMEKKTQQSAEVR